jgi:hypothetical protein
MFDINFFGGAALLGKKFPNRIVPASKTRTYSRPGTRLLALTATARISAPFTTATYSFSFFIFSCGF